MSQPTTTNSAAATLENAKNAVVDTAASTYNAAANHPLTQNVKETVANGPVAENVKDQAAKTQNEFSNLANSRTTPSQPTATGQQLTHYHSFFSSLLSWENPRASGIAYLSIVLFIFGARYLDLLRYIFKLTWMTLGVTVLAEIAGKTVFGTGFTSQLRPRKYYVVSKDTLDAMIGDVHELVNFFVIESQRIVFAENPLASLAAFISAFLSYYLIKVVPLWGMALITTTVLFGVPLIYTTNKELIDEQIQHASQILNQQTTQIRDIASHHATAAAQTTKQYVGDYSAKAQELIGSRSSSPVATTKQTPVVKTETSTVKATDFPAAPKEDFKAKVSAPVTSIPSVGATAADLRSDAEPLISA